MSTEPLTPQRPPFLTAEWRNLVILNYDLPREVLEPRVPSGTVLDTYRGRAYGSVVAFQFLNTRLKGTRVPFHADFEEVNLRFYVRRFSGTEWRRGVVFVKEIVPRPAIALTARLAYNEPYVFHPMRHQVAQHGAAGISATYEWQRAGQWHRVEATSPDAPPSLPGVGSLEEFIVEHYWGYTRQRDGSTLEYQVEHPSWRVWKAAAATLQADVADLYGPEFAEVLGRPPASALIAEGSSVAVQPGRPIPPPA